MANEAASALTTLATSGPTALWYLTRGTGAVTLVLLTVSVVLGVADLERWQGRRTPRFVIDAVHRNVSLLVIALLAVHAGVAIVDGFAPITLLDAVVPFGSAYRPLWLGLGALALDLLLAVALTSLVRARLGYRGWRAVHWLAYASFPVAVIHGLGTGSDAKQGWLVALAIACTVAVVLAAAMRITDGAIAGPGARAAALAGLALVPVGTAVWAAQGPLATGWAGRAGTPTKLLAAAPAATPARATRPAGPRLYHAPFDARVSGTVGQHQLVDGLVEVDLQLRMRGGPPGRLLVRIMGTPSPQGGVDMTQGPVYLGPANATALYEGRVTQLAGTSLRARVATRHGSRLDLAVDLRLDGASGVASGSLHASPAAAA